MSVILSHDLEPLKCQSRLEDVNFLVWNTCCYVGDLDLGFRPYDHFLQVH